MEYFKKIKENQVNIFNEVIVQDTSNIDHIILEYTNTYGQTKIDQELNKLNRELSDVQNLDAVAYKESKILEYQIDAYKLEQALLLFNTIEIDDKDGVKFTVYDPEFIKRFEPSRISTGELKRCKDLLIDVQNLDEVAYKQGLINEIQSKIDRLNLIQQEMDKEL
jgi:hypothetical protein